MRWLRAGFGMLIAVLFAAWFALEIRNILLHHHSETHEIEEGLKEMQK